jgi:hypothetical protein
MIDNKVDSLISVDEMLVGQTVFDKSTWNHFLVSLNAKLYKWLQSTYTCRFFIEYKWLQSSYTCRLFIKCTQGVSN